MATTPNYGWVTPAPTDFVTDLPADFEVFADAVDADLVGLLGGTTGQVLTKASATDHDFAFADPVAAGGMTLIAATATDGLATIDFTSIPGTFKHLLVVWDNLKSVNTNSGQIQITVNNTGAGVTDYLFGFTRVSGTTVTGSTTPTAPRNILNPQMDAAQSTQEPNSGHIWLFDYASTTQTKPYLFQSFGFSDNFTALHHLSANGRYNSNTAVTSLKFARNVAHNFADDGLIRLYGVN
jgi:hypothetical protein